MSELPTVYDADLCPECRMLREGERCIHCHMELARLEREAMGRAMVAAREDEEDDSDWIDHCDVCVWCRRDKGLMSRAMLRARCARYKEWRGPLPPGWVTTWEQRHPETAVEVEVKVVE